MRVLISAVAAMGFATQTAALSCMPADVASSYKDAAEAEESFVIAVGQFDFDVDKLPKRPVDNNNPPSTETAATFTGGLFTGRDFGFETELEVTIEARCFGPWCGWMAPDEKVLAFIEERDDGYHLSVSPCPGRVYENPTDEQLDQVVACHQGSDCTSRRDRFLPPSGN